MPVIEVKLLSGRDAELKARLIRALTDATEQTLHELPPESWGVGGVTK